MSGQRRHFNEARRVFENEIAGLTATLTKIGPEFERAVDAILASPGKVVVTGLGKSGLVGHKIAATLCSTGTPAVYMNASEALHGDLGMVSGGDVVLMLSNSANTVELIKMLPSLRKLDARVVGLFGRTDTPLAAHCDIVLDAGVEVEACPLNLAPMTSSTVALVVGDALASALMVARGFTPEQFAAFHPGGQIGRRLLLNASDAMHSGAELPVVTPAATLKEVVIEMTRTNLGGVCVCEDGRRLVGFISDGDIRRYLTRADTLSTTAAGLMTRNPITVGPATTLSEVLDLMESKGRRIYVIPVVDDDSRCVGLIRMHDIVNEN